MCCCFHEIPQKPDEGAVRRVRGAFITSTPTVFVGKTSKSKDYRKDTSNENPVNNTPGQPVDGRPKPPSMMKEKQRGRTTQDRKGQITPQTPKSETKSQHEASRLKPQGRREADRFRSNNAKIHVCTYNTRTLRTEDDTNRLVEELGNIKRHVEGLCETKRRGKDLENYQGGHGCMKQEKQRKAQMQRDWLS